MKTKIDAITSQFGLQQLMQNQPVFYQTRLPALIEYFRLNLIF